MNRFKRILKNDNFIMLLIALLTATILIVLFPNGIKPVEPTPEVETQPQPLYGTVEYVNEVYAKEWVGNVTDFQPVDCSLDVELQEFIYYLSTGYNIDFHFIMAVIEQESSYRADVISDSNDYGLMQINKCNHQWLSEALGITDFLDPYQNVIAGVYVYHTLFSDYGDDTSKVLMAYNMGRAGASKLWDKGIYQTNYSKGVMQRMQRMKGV